MATLHIWVDLVLRSGLDPWAVVKAWLFLNDWILLLFWFLDWVWDICLQTCYIYWNPFLPLSLQFSQQLVATFSTQYCWDCCAEHLVTWFSSFLQMSCTINYCECRTTVPLSSYAFFTSTKTQWSSFVLYINTLKANNTSVVLKHEAILHLTDHQLSSSTKLQQPVTPQRLRSLPLYPLSIKNHSLFSDIQGF